VRKRGRADGEDIFFFFEEDCHHYCCCCCYITVWEEQQRNLAKEAADRACAEGSPQEHIPPSCQDSPPRGIGKQMAPPPPPERRPPQQTPHTQRRDSLATINNLAHISGNNPVFSHTIQYNTISRCEASNHVYVYPHHLFLLSMGRHESEGTVLYRVLVVVTFQSASSLRQSLPYCLHAGKPAKAGGGGRLFVRLPPSTGRIQGSSPPRVPHCHLALYSSPSLFDRTATTGQPPRQFQTYR